jgi:uncharacterized protein (DUF1015 family)
MMADIQPFRAYRYDSHRVALNDVLTQPYDKITPAMQDRYYAASPYNLIPVEKGRALPDDSAANNVYTRAARKVDEWIAEKILVQDTAPNIYVYSQEFCAPGTNTRRTRIGFIALARLEDYEARVIFRHEHTLSGPRADRIELLRKTHAQTGQLFLLYDDPSKQIDTWLEQVARTTPEVELSDEFGVTHRMWPVAEPAFAERIQKAMAEKSIVIADGHHRYETALSYRDECRTRAGKADSQAPYEFAMATFVNTHSKGLTILATHRLVRNLPDFDFDRFRAALTPYFDWYAYPFVNAEERAAAYTEFRKDLERPNHGRRAIGAYQRAARSAADAFYLFVLRRGVDLESLLPDLSEGQRGLDVVLLHRLILDKGLGISAEAVTAEKNLAYEREMEAAIASVDRGDAQMALLLNPVRVEQMMKIALAGDVMPQKSTDFYPKMLSGLAVYRIDGQIGE